METLWWHNVNVPIEAARIAAQSGVVDGVIFRLTHPRDARFWGLLDGAMSFKASDPNVRVILGIDLWYSHENRASLFLSSPTVYRDNLQMIPCIRGVETLLDCEPYGSSLKRLVNARVSPEAFEAMLDDIREMGVIFDYATPGLTNKLAYPGVAVGDIYRLFPRFGRRPVIQQTYYFDLKDPQKWLDSDPDAVLGIAVSPKDGQRYFTVENGLRVYPGRSRMLYPAAGQEVACARLL